MTARGAEKLQQELQRLKTHERPSVIAAIAEARSHGDLSENAEYEAAKNRQAFIEGRIREVESKLGQAEIIDPKAHDADGRVIFGATALLLDSQSNTEITYRIVGEDEADLAAGLLSFRSPVARALIGKAAGDEALVQTPSGEKVYEILEVRYE